MGRLSKERRPFFLGRPLFIKKDYTLPLSFEHGEMNTSLTHRKMKDSLSESPFAFLARSSGFRIFKITVLFLLVGLLSTAQAANWYVKASAKDGGNGSRKKPFNTLASAEAVSGPGDTIYIRPSKNAILDGQIVLKPDQRLIGLGRKVTKAKETASAARITYSGWAGTGFPGGAVVQLSSGNEVRNIHFKDMSFDSILGFGSDFGEVKIHGNLFTHAPEFDFTVRTGIWFISLSGNSDLIVKDNVIRDGESLWGVDTQIIGDSTVTCLYEGNQFESIGFPAYSFIAGDTSHLKADILNSSANNIGALGAFSDLANSDSIAINAIGSARMDVVVDGYTYDNTDQVGSESNTGLELFTRGPTSGPPPSWADGAELNLKIKNSSFSNAVTEAIQCLNGGFNVTMNIEITDTIVLDAKPRQIGSLLEVLSGGTVTGIHGAAISILPEFLTTGSQTTLKIENCDIIGSTGYGIGVYDAGTNGFSSVFDMGGGVLGSVGYNRILENVEGEVELYQANGIGKSNWWGENPPRLDLMLGSTFIYEPALKSDPLFDDDEDEEDEEDDDDEEDEEEDD